MGDVSDVHQCFKCELRFTNRNELEEHLAVDHPPKDDDQAIEEA
jgi:hypothetical protein